MLTLNKNQITGWEVTIATNFFALAIYFNKTHYEPSFPVFIGFALYYLVFLEITRAIVEFIADAEHRLKVKYMYDGGIIFVLREILVASTVNHHHIQK